MSTEHGEQLLAAVMEMVDSECKIISCSYVNNMDFSAILRTRLKPDSAGSYSTACQAWILRFSETTKTNWIVGQNYPNLTKVEYRKLLVCQHSKKGKIKHSDRPYSRNMNCEASINVVVRKNTTNTRRSDRLMREGLNTIIEVIYVHLVIFRFFEC
jgi:hypothetical protein